MIDRRAGRGHERSTAVWSANQADNTIDGVRPSDLIRTQRAPASQWTVFVDVDISSDNQRHSARRENLVRRRPTEWGIVEDKSESNKENIGYEVRRPKRARRSLEHNTTQGGNKISVATSSEATGSPSTAEAATTPKNKGKRKLKTPSPAETKLKKPKKIKVEVRVEPEPQITPERVRRPLEDITHLFIDPTAHYFQPWRRAARMLMRASAMRIL